MRGASRETFMSRFNEMIIMHLVLVDATEIVFFYDNSKVPNLRFQNNSVKNVCMTEGAGKEILTSVIRMLQASVAKRLFRAAAKLS